MARNLPVKVRLILACVPLLMAFCFLQEANGFYLSWMSPVRSTYCPRDSNYSRNEICQQSELPLYVNRLFSLKDMISYKYSDFDFCPTNDDDRTQNIGQTLFGDRIEASAYKFQFGEDVVCRTVCKKTYNQGDQNSMEKLAFLKHAISLNYYHDWILDNLPVLWCYMVSAGGRFCSRGFPLGCFVTKTGQKQDSCVLLTSFNTHNTYYLFNHVDITISYNFVSDENSNQTRGSIAGHIISVKVQPRSIDHQKEGEGGCFFDAPILGIPGDKMEGNISFKYTYSVTWKEARFIKWSSRWDYFLGAQTSNVKWFSILNSIIVVIFLSGTMAAILRKVLLKDIAHYDKYSNFEEQKKIGWPLIRGDVFRPPRFIMLFSVFVSSGVHILITSFFVLLFASLGFLSPANRGALAIFTLIGFLLTSVLSGYFSSRIYKRIGGQNWKTNALMTVFFCPGVTVGILLILNWILYAKKSSAALPLSILTTFPYYPVSYCGIWILLTFMGAFLGNRKSVKEFPVAVNEEPHPIPKRKCAWLPFQMAVGGILPFGCLFVQLFFILNSIFNSQVYYPFYFLFMVFILLIVTCGEVAVVLCFFQLKYQNYHWWWRSFFNAGSTAIYVFLYCINYYTKHDWSGTTNFILYFGYSTVISFLVFLLTGSIGSVACLLYVCKIYGRLQNRLIQPDPHPDIIHKTTILDSGDTVHVPLSHPEEEESQSLNTDDQVSM